MKETIARWYRKIRGKDTWRDRGEGHGRTAPKPAEEPPSGHARAEPEASLAIKVTRADGTIEHYHTDAEGG